MGCTSDCVPSFRYTFVNSPTAHPVAYSATSQCNTPKTRLTAPCCLYAQLFDVVSLITNLFQPGWDGGIVCNPKSNPEPIALILS